METQNDAAKGSSYTPPPGPPAAEPASKVEDFIDIFASPSQVFARREKSGFGLHLLIVSVLMAAFAFASRGVMTQVMDAMYTRRAGEMMAKDPRITAEMIEAQRGMQTGVGMFFSYVGTPVMILFMALFIWLLAKLFSAKLSYGQAALITTLAWIPRLVGSLLTTVQVALTDTSNVDNMYDLTASPARFMDESAVSAKLYALAGNLDVFAIWSTILVGIGIAVIGKVPRSRGLLAAGTFFVISTALVVAFS